MRAARVASNELAVAMNDQQSLNQRNSLLRRPGTRRLRPGSTARLLHQPIYRGETTLHTWTACRRLTLPPFARRRHFRGYTVQNQIR